MRKRKDGLYEMKFQGKSIYASSPKKVKEKIAALRQKEVDGYTFQEVSDAYREYIYSPEAKLRRGTISCYIKYLDKLDPEFGPSYIGKIDSQAVRSYLDRMKLEGYGQKTVTSCRSVLSCVFNYWCAFMHGTGNPVALAGLPAGMVKGERLPPTKNQIRLINAHPDGDGFWAQLFRYTGVRIAEANALRWRDINWEESTLTVDDARPWDRNQPYEEDTKTAKGHRRIPLPDAFIKLAKPLSKLHSPDDFIMSGTDKPLTQSQYTTRWTKYCRSIGLAQSHEEKVKIPKTACRPERTVNRTMWRADVTAHQFRHLYATALFKANIPDKEAQHYLGHADITTTKRIYQHIDEEQDSQMLRRLNLYFNNEIS